MAGRTSRNKGARGEREAIALLQPIVDRACDHCGQPRIELVRDTRQRYQKKLYDIFGLPWIALEIKRVENQSGINGWWKQVKEATKPGQIPVLMYRQNNAPWKIRTRLPIKIKDRVSVIATVTMDFSQWATWLETKIRMELVGSR